MALARSIASLSRRCLNRIWRSPAAPKPEDERHALGRRGERLAARQLRKQGYRVLYRGFRAPGGGEVDLVARDGDTLAFIEVKTRSSLEFGRPYEAVGADKQRLIIRGALAWLRALDNPDILFRFDIAEVVIPPGAEPEFHLIRDAFTLPSSYIY